MKQQKGTEAKKQIECRQSMSVCVGWIPRKKRTGQNIQAHRIQAQRNIQCTVKNEL